jgi:hypothetical protein
MKTNRIAGVSPEKAEELKRSPKVAALVDRFQRLTNGTATPQERAAFEERTKRMREMPKGTLSEDLT